MRNKKPSTSKKAPKEPTEKQKIGRIGEDCACEYLRKNGYTIIDRNYLKKWGEIDIVAKKGRKLHFVEVKAVTRVISPGVTRETNGTISTVLGTYAPKTPFDAYRPEDNLHPWKLQRLSRVIQSYLLQKDIPDDVDWQFDVVTVYLDMSKRISRVFLLEDVIL